MDPTQPHTQGRKSRKSTHVLAAALGAIVGIGCVLLFWLFSFRDPLPPLSATDFQAAQNRWRENGPQDYFIEVRVQGRQPATYRVEVQDGEAVRAFRNGQPLNQKRTWGTWSVPGMFSTMASDFRQVAMFQSGRGDENTSNLGLYGVFDPYYGYPQRYRRITWSQGREDSMAHRVGQAEGGVSGGDAEMEVSWEVVQFVSNDDH